MKQQTALVQMPMWETLLCGSVWIYMAARAWYAVFEASRGEQFHSYCTLILLVISEIIKFTFDTTMQNGLISRPRPRLSLQCQIS